MSDLAAIKIPVDTSDIPKAIAVVNKLQAEIVSFEKAVRAGTLSVFSQNAGIAKSTKQLEQLGYTYWEAKGMVNGFAKSLKTMTEVELAQAGRGFSQSQKEMRNFELGVQQAGYQIGDFAVQVQSGTSPLVAFSQQFSQLIGFFGGPWGAAIGAGAAILSGLALAFMDTKTAAESLKDSLQGVEEALSELKDAQANYSLDGINELIEKYGELDSAVLRLVDSEMRLAEVRANNKINELTASLSDLSRWYDIGTDDATSSAMHLTEMFEISMNAARELYTAIEDVGKAKGFEEKANALSVVNGYLETILAGEEKITDEQMKMAENFLHAESLARQMANAAPSESWMDAATKGVQSLVDKLTEAFNLSWKLRSEAPAPMDTGNMDWAKNNLGFVLPGSELIPQQPKVNTGSSGGGAAKVDPMKRLKEQIALETELLDKTEAQKRVLQSLGENRSKYSEKEIEAVTAEIESYNTKMEVMKQQEQIMKSVESSLEDGFMSMVDGTKSVKDAFKSMAADIIKELYRVFVVQRMVGAISNAFGSMTAPSTGSFGLPFGRASGGSIMGGTPYLVGEHGPELVIPRHSATVINANQTANALGGGAGNVTVQNNITVTGSDAAMVRAEVAKMIPQITNATKAAVIDAKQRGGQMAAAFR